MAPKKSNTKKSKKHPGFENVAEKIAQKQDLPIDRARAIVAAGARKASAKAKRENPRLKKVKGA